MSMNTANIEEIALFFTFEQVNDPRILLTQRILDSKHFSGSIRLRNFLKYIVDCAVREVPGEVSEHHIGVRVFGRPSGYNSSEDNIVRSHARILRSKLAGYFADHGHCEKMTIEIPKGQYFPIFRQIVPNFDQEIVASNVVDAIEAVAVKQDMEMLVSPVREVPNEAQDRTSSALPLVSGGASRRFTIDFKLVAAGLCFLIIVIGFSRWSLAKPAVAASEGTPSLWQPFLSDDSPQVIYGDGRSYRVGDAANYPRSAGMRNPKSELYNDDDPYIGGSEVVTVHELTKLFDSYQKAFTLKQVRFVAWDETKWHNLIVMGPAAEDESMRAVLPVWDFTMDRARDGVKLINHAPKRGEASEYAPAPPDAVDHTAKEYALLALVPGLEPNMQVLVFDGATSLGTEAAMEYARNPQSMSDLLRSVSFQGQVIHPFEAVLEVPVYKGVALQAKLVAIHTH